MLNRKYDRTWAEIDLSAVRRNVINAKKNIPSRLKFCAVVKTDAYGHGAPAIAWAIDDLTDMYAVAEVTEGAILRRHGITKPILCLGVIPESGYEEMLKNHIMPPVFTVEQAESISKAAERLGFDEVSVTMALDTGMGRIGIQVEETDALEIAKKIAETPRLKLETVFTHFATADEKDQRFTKVQLDRYRAFVEKLEAEGIHIPIKHCANSASIIDKVGTEFDMVRDGICIYGILPSDEMDANIIKLTPVLSWRSEVVFVKDIPAGTPISYGCTFVSRRPMKVATVSCGYGDGLPRALSNKAEVLVHGKRCRILGRVCMDQFMIDVTEVKDAPVSVGDVVTMLGRDQDDELMLYDWEAFGLFTYEVLCDIGKRVPRVYLKDGEVVGTHDMTEEMYRDFIVTIHR